MATEYKNQSVIACKVVADVHRVVREAGVQVRDLVPVVADVVWHFTGYFKVLITACLFCSFPFPSFQAVIIC